MDKEEKQNNKKPIRAEDIPKADITMSIAKFCTVIVFIASAIFFVLNEYLQIKNEVQTTKSTVAEIKKEQEELNDFVNNGYITRLSNGELKFRIDYEGLTCIQIREKIGELNSSLQSKKCK